MRAYQVSFSTETKSKKAYCDTQKSARAKRREFMEAEGLKIAEVQIDQVEIPTKKEALLEWLNQAF